MNFSSQDSNEADDGSLPFEKIHLLCSTFVQESDRPDRRPIHEYLQQVAEAAQPTLLRNLLHFEVAKRRAAGEQPSVEEYLRDLPAFTTLVKQVFLDSTTCSLAQSLSHDLQSTVIYQSPVAGHLGPYRLIRELGRGGMGTVYEAQHLQLGQRVALKTLPQLDGDRLLRFKREFRALTNVNHPNLIGLHSLESDGAHWFLTMDLIEGTDFLCYVRPDNMPDDGRLRNSFTQLVAGVLALHSQHIIHRDLKPSNVMVSQDGRVIILDFGLVLEDIGNKHAASIEGFAGTPQYMSPEQGMGERVTGASDWYTVGIMLYEALSGRQPHRSDSVMKLLRMKLEQEPAPLPGSAECPADLAQFAMQLLRRVPGERPDALEIATKFGGSLPLPASPAKAEAGSSTVLFGREFQRDQLQSALEHTRTEQDSCVVFVSGLSGEGKTSLVKEFLDRSRTKDARLTILSGRCYDRESVPFKAIDNLIDSLTSYLRSLNGTDAALLMPDDIGFLSHLFPVLQRVETVGRMMPRKIEQLDSQQVRTRAFSALRSLLIRVTRVAPVVLFCDDLQWGDVDSADALFTVLKGPDSPAVLFVGTYRADETDSSPFIQRWNQLNQEHPNKIQAQKIAVGPLDLEACTQLLITAVGQDTTAVRARAADFSQQTGGNPYLLTELVDCYDSTAESFRALPMKEVIQNKLTRLPPQALHLLELVSVSGQALTVAEATGAVQHETDGMAILTHMRSEKLIRLIGSDDCPRVDTWHDKIRETVLRDLEPVRRRSWHRALALVIEEISESKLSDQQLENIEQGQMTDLPAHSRIYDLAYHWNAASETRRACVFAVLAAEQAAGQVSHQVAAEQYAIARRNVDVDRPELRFRIARGLGRSLTLTGQYDEALNAIEGAETWTQDSLQQAQILGLRAEINHKQGKIAGGVSLYSAALRTLGFWVPESIFELMVGLARESLIQVLHGVLPQRFYVNDAAPSEAEALAVELANRNSIVSYYVNGLRMLWTHVKGVNLAETRQESPGLAYAYGLHPAPMSAIGLGARGLKRSDRAIDIARQNADLMTEGHTRAMRSMAYYTLTEYDLAITEAESAIEILNRTGDPYLIFIAQGHIVFAAQRVLQLERALETGASCFDRAVRTGEDASAGIIFMCLAYVSEGNFPFSELSSCLSLQDGDHWSRASLGLSEGLWHLHHHRLQEASELFWNACRLSREHYLFSSYTAHIYSWSVTAHRRYALSLPEGPERKQQLRRARSICRSASALSVLFKHERPHVLRERAHLKWAAGSKQKAIRLLQRSVETARLRGDEYQRNLSALELADRECELNVPGALQRQQFEKSIRQEILDRIDNYRRQRWPTLS